MSGAVRVDVAIAGGGIVGLSLGLELRRRGLSVAVMERDRAMGGASWAAAGMLAVHDPQNPPELLALSLRSWELYPDYLRRVEELSGKRVPLRTRWAMQHVSQGESAVTLEQLAELAPGLQMRGVDFAMLEEGSFDPRDLCAALPVAFAAAGGMLLERTEVLGVESSGEGVEVDTPGGRISAGAFVNCCGAWAGDVGRELGDVRVAPVKGQMVNLRCAPEALKCVVRAPGVYMVPRGDGRVTVGSTIEHVGFNTEVEAASIARLIDAARRLLPELAEYSPMAAWAGLRPGTPDGLPILGRAATENCWHATGHFRDGILLAPATAEVMAQAILGEAPRVALEPFSATRF
jgi:glycine oxidase